MLIFIIPTFYFFGFLFARHNAYSLRFSLDLTSSKIICLSFIVDFFLVYFKFCNYFKILNLHCDVYATDALNSLRW